MYDAVNVNYINNNNTTLTNLMDSKDTIVTNAYIAADVVLDNKIDSLKSKLVDNVGNTITMLNGNIS